MKIQVSSLVTGYNNKTANMTPLIHIIEHNKNKMNSNCKKHCLKMTINQ